MPMVGMFINRSGRNEHLYRGPSIDASYQVLVHLAKRFQRRCFRHQPIRNKNCRWQLCLLTDRDEMSKLYRGPFIDAFYHVSFHLVMWLQRRRFKKSTNQKQELSVVAMFVNETGRYVQSLQRTFHRCFLPSFSSFELANQFQRRIFFQIDQSETRIACVGHVC